MNSLRVKNAHLLWQEDGRPYASEYEDVFFTRGDEIAESEYVFIQANRLLERWTNAADESRTFVIGELGFGCSLNFLNTWRAWRHFKLLNPTSPLRLHFVTVEKHPLRHADLRRVYELWPNLKELSAQFLSRYPDHSSGCHRLNLQADVTLDIHYGDALELFQQFTDSGTFAVECWYADGFNPSTNPDLWQRDLFRNLARCSSPGATLSTYSAAGAVRRALQDNGFAVTKLAGFGNKRHMLSAQFNPESGHSLSFRKSNPTPEERHIVIVGAGLAGCALAHSLARRNWRVTLIEGSDELLTGASGSGQLNLRCHLIATASPLARFYLQAFLFARQQFESLTSALPEGEEGFWHPSPFLQLDSSLKPETPAELANYKDTLLKLYEQQVLSATDAETLDELAGLEIGQAGLLLPLGGWVNPAGLIQSYLHHPLITLVTGTPVSHFDHDDKGRWRCFADDGSSLCEGSRLALCTAAALGDWQQTRNLPLQAVRGQNTFIRHLQLAKRLRAIVCGERTIFPSDGEKQTISASYHRDESSLLRSARDDNDNLACLANDITEPDIMAGEVIAARVALRYNSIDHAPVIGPMPDWQASIENCAAAKPRHRELESRFCFYPGLFVNSAHASSGLASCALAGEYLASLINGEPSPVESDAMRQLAPARFLLRELRKQFL